VRFGCACSRTNGEWLLVLSISITEKCGPRDYETQALHGRCQIKVGGTSQLRHRRAIRADKRHPTARQGSTLHRHLHQR